MGAGLAHSLLMILAFDPVGIWPAALVAIAPLVWAAIRKDAAGTKIGAVRLIAAVWVGCVPLYLFEQGWSVEVSAGGYPLMAMYLALYPALMVWLLRRASERLKGIPIGVLGGVLWTALEVVEGDVMFKGYGWFTSVHPLVDWPPIAACAGVVGVYGTSLLVSIAAASATAMCMGVKRGQHGGLLAAVAAVWLLMGLLGWMHIERHIAERSARVGVVQTNLPQSNKIAPDLRSTMGLWRELERLTVEAGRADPKPDVIVWPETMKPGMALDVVSVRAEREAKVALFPKDRNSTEQPVLTASFADATLELQRRVGIPLLVGEDAYDDLRFEADAEGRLNIKYRHRFNSAFLVEGGTVSARRYDKVRLTPFGEEMPYISAWPWLEAKLLNLAARGMRLDLSSGTELTVFEIPMAGGTAVRLVTPICFEATEWDLCRRMVFDGTERRADVLVNMTNDGWFGDWWRAGRAQHLQIARWRCIELGTPMVRAANTGISCLIDAHGRVDRISAGAEKADWKAGGVLKADVRLSDATTLYVRGGWLSGWVVLVLGGLVCAGMFLPRGNAGRTPASNPA